MTSSAVTDAAVRATVEAWYAIHPDQYLGELQMRMVIFARNPAHKDKPVRLLFQVCLLAVEAGFDLGAASGVK